ncbi:MAG: signal peptidase I [Verrucomicrobia bacterium]|nr:signal peptidase I [Verrucomicrobiota bacterium]
MIGLFTPRYIKNGTEMLHAARKMLSYKRDLLKPEEVQRVEGDIAHLQAALRHRDRPAVEKTSHELDRFFGERFPTPTHPELRENCEVFLVAIVIALGIRTFFLQPFTIPTGSMQPTLNGIKVEATFEMACYGRSYFNIVSKEDDTIISMRDITRLRFFSYAEIQCLKQTFLIPASARAVAERFKLQPGTSFQAGQVVARGYADTGDHVFVNKMAYNFRNPRRGEVFVFSTANILTEENKMNPGGPSQYYIKRLAGLPGDELRVDPPKLFINGKVAHTPAFARVMSGSYDQPNNGYRGYGNGPAYLTDPDSTFRVPEKRYFAMGDNSYNSADSRYWGTVPEENLVGCGLFVYWPFTHHWGLIH